MGKYLMIQIGQVDVEYVWYYKQMKHCNTLCFDEHQIQISVNNLFKFLKDYFFERMDNAKIVIHGIHLPPLNNKNMSDILYHHFMHRADLKKEYLDKNLILPSHQKRTKMAIRFNQRLKQKCKEFGCLFVDISTEILDEQTGVVRNEFVEENEIDIHLKEEALIPIYAKQYKALNLDFAKEIESKWQKLEVFEAELQRNNDQKYDVIVCNEHM